MKGNIPILTSSRWNPHESSQIQPVYTKVHYIKIIQHPAAKNAMFFPGWNLTNARSVLSHSCHSNWWWAGKSTLFHGAFHGEINKYQGFFSKACFINWEGRQGCEFKPGNAKKLQVLPIHSPVHPGRSSRKTTTQPMINWRHHHETCVCSKFWSPNNWLWVFLSRLLT